MSASSSTHGIVLNTKRAVVAGVALAGIRPDAGGVLLADGIFAHFPLTGRAGPAAQARAFVVSNTRATIEASREAVRGNEVAGRGVGVPEVPTSTRTEIVIRAVAMGTASVGIARRNAKAQERFLVTDRTAPVVTVDTDLRGIADRAATITQRVLLHTIRPHVTSVARTDTRRGAIGIDTSRHTDRGVAKRP